MIVLDPWNEVEHKRRRDETETDYIGRAIRAIKRFAKQYDVAFWIVAQPDKTARGSRRIPGLYDISGSANWANTGGLWADLSPARLQGKLRHR